MFVGVTICYGPDGFQDLILPASMTVHEAANLLGSCFLLPAADGRVQKFVLQHLEGGGFLQPSLPVRETHVVDGDHLRLLSKKIPAGFLTLQQYEKLQGPALAGSGGEYAPLSARCTVLCSSGSDKVAQTVLEIHEFPHTDGADEVSVQHALLLRTREGYLIQDLDSSQGIYLNNSRLRRMQNTCIYHCDVIRIGTAELLFVCDSQIRPELRGRGIDCESSRLHNR